MIYVDASVLLAALLREGMRPSPRFWSRELVSSRLLQYEVINRVQAYGADPKVLVVTHNLLDRVEYVELEPPRLARALEPFPVPVRTLDGLHLATMDYLRNQGATVEIATYDRRLSEAAAALGFAAVAL